MSTELSEKLQYLLYRAREAYAADHVQECCGFLDDLNTLADEHKVEVPIEATALAVLCMEADKATLKTTEATATT